MVTDHELGKILVEDCFVELFIFFLVSFYEKSSWFSEENVDDCHWEEILGGCDVGYFDAVAEEDVADDEEINVGSVGRDDDEGTIALSVIFYLSDVWFVDNYFLVYCAEEFVEKPAKQTDGFHGVVTEHLGAELLSYFC